MTDQPRDRAYSQVSVTRCWVCGCITVGVYQIVPNRCIPGAVFCLYVFVPLSFMLPKCVTLNKFWKSLPCLSQTIMSHHACMFIRPGFLQSVRIPGLLENHFNDKMNKLKILRQILFSLVCVYVCVYAQIRSFQFRLVYTCGYCGLKVFVWVCVLFISSKWVFVNTNLGMSTLIFLLTLFVSIVLS